MLSNHDYALALGMRSWMVPIGREVLAIRDTDMKVKEKTNNRDIVTLADSRAEAMLLQCISAAFPKDGIYGEEGSSKYSASGARWYLDPVDGTSNFASGNPFFGISAGRAREGRCELGALFFPVSRQFYFAVRGGGAWWSEGPNGELQELTRRPVPQQLKGSVIAVGLRQEHANAFPVFRKQCRNVLALGSFIYETMLVARGELAAYVHTGATQFDCGAAPLIAEEAGCFVQRLDNGGPIDLRKENIPVAIAGDAEIMEQIFNLAYLHIDMK